MYDLLLSSESNSDNCVIYIIAALSKLKHLTKNNYLKTRKTQREFILKDEFSEENHKN